MSQAVNGCCDLIPTGDRGIWRKYERSTLGQGMGRRKCQAHDTNGAHWGKEWVGEGVKHMIHSTRKIGVSKQPQRRAAHLYVKTCCACGSMTLGLGCSGDHVARLFLLGATLRASAASAARRVVRGSRLCPGREASFGHTTATACTCLARLNTRGSLAGHRVGASRIRVRHCFLVREKPARIEEKLKRHKSLSSHGTKC